MSVPPITAADLQNCPVVIIHYWAAWNECDFEYDLLISRIRKEYSDRICFRACNVDDEAARSVTDVSLSRVPNIPALECYTFGKLHETLIGMRSESFLRSKFEAWLAHTSPSRGLDYLRERAKRGSAARLKEILAKVPDAEPDPEDRIE
jgi:hypothetical protein